MEISALSQVMAMAALAAGQITQNIQTNINNKAASKQAALDAQNLANQKAEAETKRLNLLKTQMAKQRAKFGAAGINPDEGSAANVLEEIKTNAEDELEVLNTNYRYRLDSLNNSLATSQRKNLLASASSTFDTAMNIGSKLLV